MKKILIIYDHHWLPIKTIANYLESFRRFSRHQIYYASSFGRCRFNLEYFDAVVIHFSVKVCYAGFLSRSYAKAIRRFKGVKILFLQDEYEATDANCRAIEDLGIEIVFTCVPPESIAKVYPPKRFSRTVSFESVLAGYVPLDLVDPSVLTPIRDRRVLIGYRGRRLGYWYGDLGQEKLRIGQRMKEICDARGLATNIAWEENDRIYGEEWFRFLAGSKATLATESGANVFDLDGTLTNRIQRELYRDPNIPYEEIHEKYLKQIDGRIVMNQISPKVFEAIACKTALILFEGEYSGILAPHRHYIPLRKDFSNVDLVLSHLADDAYLDAMAQRAYDDIVASGRYSYERFVQGFDNALERHWPPQAERASAPWLPLPPCDALAGFQRSYAINSSSSTTKRSWVAWPVKAILRPIFKRERLKRIYVMLPGFLRRLLAPAAVRLKSHPKQTSITRIP